MSARRIEVDPGTVRGISTTTISQSAGSHRFWFLVVEMFAAGGGATLDVVLRQGTVAAGAFKGSAYTPPGGAFAQFVANSVQTREIEIRGDVLQVDLIVAAAGCSTRVILIGKA